MSSDWELTRLRDHIRVKHGFAFKGEHFADEPTEYQLTTPGNFAIGGGFQDGKAKYYNGPIPAEFVLNPGDLLVTMTDLSKAADTLGYSAVVPKKNGITWLHNQRVGRVQLLPGKSTSLTFLHYLLRSPDYRHHVLAGATGSTVKHTSPDRILDFQFLLPPPSEAHRIGNLLDALDDRITLLRETNATLEAIAQALFKSWFVDFDPVRAKRDGRAPKGMDEATAALFPNSFEDSELGEVPRGWRVMPMAEAYELNPTRKLSKGTPAPYLDMANVPTQGFGVAAVTMRELGSGTKFIAGDTLLARITPCLENGKSAFVDFLSDGQVGWGSTEFVVLRPRPPLPAFHAYLLCRHQPFREHAMQSMSGTSGRQRIQNDVLGRYMLAVPSEPVAMAFDEAVTAIQRKATANNAQARTLATLRDTLLTRLISGQLRLPGGQV